MGAGHWEVGNEWTSRTQGNVSLQCIASLPLIPFLPVFFELTAFTSYKEVVVKTNMVHVTHHDESGKLPDSEFVVPDDNTDTTYHASQMLKLWPAVAVRNNLGRQIIYRK